MARFIWLWMHPEDRKRLARYLGDFLREAAILIAVFGYLDQLFEGDGALDAELTLGAVLISMTSFTLGVVAGCWSERGEQ